MGGILRIAHCGGLHVPQLNKLIDAINFVAKLLHRRIRWDTETLGCVPSLSSIPAYDQRLLTDALQVGGAPASPASPLEMPRAAAMRRLISRQQVWAVCLLACPKADAEPGQASRSLPICTCAPARPPSRSGTPPPADPVPPWQEVKAWMDRPENALEFVILYFDDQPNLQAWVSGTRVGAVASWRLVRSALGGAKGWPSPWHGAVPAEPAPPARTRE